METALSPAARRVRETLRQMGFENEVVEFPESTRTAAEAAAVCGCEVAQIAKSLVFRGKTSGRPVLVITSGKNRVDEKKLSALIGEPVGKADAEFVRERTGYAIGGVPPLARAEDMPSFLDRDLMAYETVWAAAGTPRAVFRLTPEELLRMSGAQVAEVA